MLSVSPAATGLGGESAVKTVGISIKPKDAQARSRGIDLVHWLRRRGQSVLVDDSLATACDLTPVSLEAMTAAVDLMVILGGDGTLLRVARSFIGTSVPILGINLGRLGFLTEAPVDDMFQAVEKVLQGGGQIVRHFSLFAEARRGERMLDSGSALNDVVLQRNQHPRMIEFEMRVRRQFVFRLRADGLVLATPAGSTAYALSAGSAIVHPGLDAISVVPICPHTLSNRPIILPATDPIELRLTESPAPAALNLDGQVHLELEEGDRIHVKKGGSVSLAYLPGRNYFKVLRSKLHWAGRTDERNDVE